MALTYMPSNLNKVYMTFGLQIVSCALVNLTGTRCGDNLQFFHLLLTAAASDPRT